MATWLPNSYQLAAILDANVGEAIDIELERGGAAVAATVVVDDLHAITPSEYVEVGDGHAQ